MSLSECVTNSKSFVQHQNNKSNNSQLHDETRAVNRVCIGIHFLFVDTRLRSGKVAE